MSKKKTPEEPVKFEGEEKYREIARMGFALWWEAKQFEVFRNLKCPQ